MYDTQFPSAKELLGQQKLRRNFLLALFVAVLGTILGLMVWIAYNMPSVKPPILLALGSVMFVCLVVPVIIWNYPRAGLYMLFAATTVFPADPRSNNTQKPTANFPFFLNFNNVGEQYHIGGLAPFKFSPAELLIVLTLLVWLIRSIMQRDLRFRRGPLLYVLLPFAATTIMGYVHGVAAGGDPIMALWEARAQFYPLLVYVVAVNLITERRHIEQLLWIAFVGLSLKSLEGVFSYFQMGGVVTDQGILDHEDSLILNVFIFLMLYLKMNGGSRKMVRYACFFLPTIVFVLLENQRRAGIAAFVLAFIASMPIMWVLFEEKRRQITAFIVVISAIGAVYLPIAWNAQGAWALPGRAIRSNFSPDDRDAESNNYRVIEDFDLNYTRNLSPIIGYGYGRMFIQVKELPEVATDFLKFFAHDSVLWIWMRTGHIGFFCFMFFIATVFIRGLQICRETRDPLLQAAGLMGVIYVLMAYVYGKYDLQLTNYRSMLMFGVWIGILGALPYLNTTEEAPKPMMEDDEFIEYAPGAGNNRAGFLEGEPL